MEDLNDYVTMRKGLVAGQLYPRVGLAHVADLETITHPHERAAAEIRALKIGQWLIINYRKLTHYDEFIETLVQLLLLTA